MIKNKRALLKGEFKKERNTALSVIEAGLEAVGVKGAVKKATLPHLKKFENVYVVGFGKASAAMAEALEQRLGNRIKAGAVVSMRKAKTKKIMGFRGSHPIPGKENVRAAKKILEIAKKAGKKDLVIALVSGGGSALLALPAKSVNRRALQRTTEALVRSKATIDEINYVRKHISAIKGGQLMRAIYPATLHALIVSDVIGNQLETIASGPTAPDKSTFKQAIAVINKYNLWKKVSKDVRQRLSQGAMGKVSETPKPGNKIFKKAKNNILLNNAAALNAMKKKAKHLGLNATVYSGSVKGEAREIGKKLVRIAGKRKPAALLAGGETTVTVKGKGKGGRNQEMVLGALQELEKSGKAVFVSVGSDGIDGNSKAAGAIADSATLRTAIKKGLNPEEFLKRNDSNSFFKKVKGEVLTGYTETNVMDLQLVLIK